MNTGSKTVIMDGRSSRAMTGKEKALVGRFTKDLNTKHTKHTKKKKGRR
jgi:hypothetical protein